MPWAACQPAFNISEKADSVKPANRFCANPQKMFVYILRRQAQAAIPNQEIYYDTRPSPASDTRIYSCYIPTNLALLKEAMY